MSMTQIIKIPLTSDSHNSRVTAELVLETNISGEVEISLTDSGREIAVKKEDLFKAVTILNM